MKRKRALDRFTAIRLIAGIAALLTFCLVKFYIDGEFRTWMEVLEKTDQGSRDYTRIYSVFIPFGFVLLYLIQELLLLAGSGGDGFLASGAGIYYVCRSFGIYNVFGRYTPLCEDSVILYCHVYRGVYKY